MEQTLEHVLTSTALKMCVLLIRFSQPYHLIFHNEHPFSVFSLHIKTLNQVTES